MSCRPLAKLKRRFETKPRFWIAAALCALLCVPLTAGRAGAGEPRPWLCRDKPAITSPGATQMVVTRHDRRVWQMFLLQLAPGGGGHDGFTVVRSYALAGLKRSDTGNLPRGQFFAVPLYRSGAYWMCPGEVDDNTRPGEIAHICFSANRDGACDVSLSANRTRS
jgi:hypothetical protein